MLVYAQTWEMMYVYCMQFNSLYIDTLIKVWANNAFNNYKDKKIKEGLHISQLFLLTSVEIYLKKNEAQALTVESESATSILQLSALYNSNDRIFSWGGDKSDMKKHLLLWGGSVLYPSFHLLIKHLPGSQNHIFFVCVCLEEVKQVISVLPSRWPWPFLHPSVCHQSPCRHAL